MPAEGRPRRTVIRAAALAAVALAAGAARGGEAAISQAEIRSYPITHFKVGSDQTRFGPLEFVGGLEMTSPNEDFGSLSAIRFRDRGSRFLCVMDSGFWCGGTVERDAAGRPKGMTDFRIESMRDRKGQVSGDKWETDAEGLALKGKVATASFERAHRVTDYRFDGTELPTEPLGNADLVVPLRELRRNRGFETVVYAPQDGPLKGARVIVSERSLDADGNIFAAVTEGPGKGIFRVRRSDDFDVTDGAFLPDGDLLLLERHFSMARGVLMRLRRIPGDTIRAGAIVDGEVLLVADLRYQIDNMEGLDVWRDDSGAVRVAMVSDDNHSILQRNLYLEFRFAE